MKKPIYSLLVAMDENRLIGRKGTLPWRLPDDVRYFKQVTMGHPIVMGRKTWESLPKRPLPGRRNIVISTDPDYMASGAEVITNPEKLRSMFHDEEVFIIGGGATFEYFMPWADRLYITEIDGQFEGDTYFPQFNKAEWELVWGREGDSDDQNPYAHRYLVYKRVSK